MARAIICDRCGKTVRPIEAERVVFYSLNQNGNYSANNSDAHADLCPGCYIEFKNMLGLELRVEVDENA